MRKIFAVLAAAALAVACSSEEQPRLPAALRRGHDSAKLSLAPPQFHLPILQFGG